MSQSFFQTLPLDILSSIAHTVLTEPLNPNLALILAPDGPFHSIAAPYAKRLTVSFDDDSRKSNVNFVDDASAADIGVYLNYYHDFDLCQDILRTWGDRVIHLSIEDFPPKRENTLEHSKKLIELIASSCTNVVSLRLSADADRVYWNHVLETTLKHMGGNLRELELDACGISAPFSEVFNSCLVKYCKKLRRIAILRVFRLGQIPWYEFASTLEEVALIATHPIDWGYHFDALRSHCKLLHTVEVDIGNKFIARMLTGMGQNIKHATLRCPSAQNCEKIMSICGRNATFKVRAAGIDMPGIAIMAKNIRELGLTLNEEIDEKGLFDGLVDLHALTLNIDGREGCSEKLAEIFHASKNSLQYLLLSARNSSLKNSDIEAIARGTGGLRELVVNIGGYIESVGALKLLIENNPLLEKVTLKERVGTNRTTTGKRVGELLSYLNSAKSLRFVRISTSLSSELSKSKEVRLLRRRGVCVLLSDNKMGYDEERVGR